MTRAEAYYILRVSRDEMQSKGHTEFDMLDLPCLDMAIAALREQPRWISVQEKLPENNDKVLAFTLSGKYAVARYDQRRQCWIAAGNLTVTHWMPLPDVPEVEV